MLMLVVCRYVLCIEEMQCDVKNGILCNSRPVSLKEKDFSWNEKKDSI